METEAPIQRVQIDEGVNLIELDCTVSEQHDRRVTLTRHPIEEGADPTDHARVMPDTLTLQAVLSNNAYGYPDARASDVGQQGVAQGTYTKLLALSETRRPVLVVTPLRRYEDMLLTYVGTPVSPRSGDSVSVSLTFEEIRIVKSERVRLEQITQVPAAPARPVKRTDQGKKAPEDANPSLRNSTLKSLTDTLGITKSGSGLIGGGG